MIEIPNNPIERLIMGVALNSPRDIGCRYGVPHHRIMDAYRGPERHYHGLGHIGECLIEVRRLDDLFGYEKGFLAEVNLALLFHDVVYDTTQKDNEYKSAALAVSMLSQAGANESSVSAISEAIMATVHNGNAEGDLAQLVCDIDVMSLAHPRQRFIENTHDIRAEYSWVPSEIFMPRRMTILESFLNREHIYFTQEMYERYEECARENLRLSIEALSRGELG